MYVMPEPEAIKLLEKYDIPYPNHIFVTDRSRLTTAAEKLGFPLVMKIVSPDIVHKSDAGGVRLDLKNFKEVIAAYDEIICSIKHNNPSAEISGVLLCSMAETGVEVIIGMVHDEVFGPTIMFGLGGIFVEVLEDVTFRVCPIDEREAIEMLNEIKGGKILRGIRGRQALDVKSLAKLISVTTQMVTENPQINELDFNPVRVYDKGVMVLDARIIC